MHQIFASAVGFGAMYVTEYELVNLTGNNGARKACVLGALYRIIQERCFLFPVMDKSFLGSRKSCRNLRCYQHVLVRKVKQAYVV